MKKKHLAALALALLLLIPSAWIPAAADSRTDVFFLNYSDCFPREIQLSPDSLIVSGIPASKDFAWIWLILEDGNGKEARSEILKRDGQNRAEFSLEALRPGEYSLELYRGTEEYTTYSLFVDGVQIQWNGGEGTFLRSPAYALNQKRTGSENSTPQALAAYLKASQDIQSDDQAIIRLANTITAGLETSYAKAMAVHDWVCGEIYYDYDALCGRTPYGEQSALAVLSRRRTVCAGYANLTAALLRAAGIPAKTVSGYALGLSGGSGFPQAVLNGGSDTNHAWVEAWADNRWIIIDPTWDSGNDWEYGRASESKGCCQHRYFDIAPELFAADHALVYPNNYGEMYLYVDYPEYRIGQEWKSYGGKNAAPAVIGGTVMAPVGAIAEEIGVTLFWDKTSDPGWSRLVLDDGDHHVQMWLGYSSFYVNGTEYRFDVAPRLINGVTMVQIRPLLQAMDGTVVWDDWADGWNGRVTLGYFS